MSSLFGKKKKKRLLEQTKNEAEFSSSLQSEKKVNSNVVDSGNGDGNGDGDEKVYIHTFSDMKKWLCGPLLRSCAAMGFSRPTAVQKVMIPAILSNESQHLLALSSTGSGKTAAFVLPILQKLSEDPYGIFAVILSPTRELAKQIVEHILALGMSSLHVRASLIVGGMDMVKQSCELATKQPHIVVATPGRLASLLRGPNPPNLHKIRFAVLDEADRLLSSNSGFEKDVAEILLHTTSNGKRRRNCQTLLFSATMTKSLAQLEEMAGAGLGRLPLRKYVIRENASTDQNDHKNKKKKRSRSNSASSISSDDEGSTDDEQPIDLTPTIPEGLKQEYIFMPSRVRDTYLAATIRTLMVHGGKKGNGDDDRKDSSGWNDLKRGDEDDDQNTSNTANARSAIVFVSSCERAALVSGMLAQLGVSNVALHSLLTQPRRLASLAKFKSQQVRVLVCTDVGSRGLDIPTVDLVINVELPRRPIEYVHRVGRTARAGRRGRAISLVGEADVSLVHAAEQITKRPLMKCTDITDDIAIPLLNPVSKAIRVTKYQLLDIGFDKLLEKHKQRKLAQQKQLQRQRKLKLKRKKITSDSNTS